MNGNKSAVVVMLFTSWTNSTLAADTPSGRIEIQGTLTESICNINQQQKQFTVSCSRDGNVQNIVSTLGSSIIPANMGRSDVLWLDEQQQQGVITVSYN